MPETNERSDRSRKPWREVARLVGPAAWAIAQLLPALAPAQSAPTSGAETAPDASSQSTSFTLVLESDAPMPPAALVRAENPARAAILRHEVRASLDPASGTIRATDRVHVLHAPGVPGSEPFPVLLWSHLKLREVRVEGARAEVREHDRMQPRAFWKRPPYAELSGYDRARQIDVSLSGEADWPETLAVTFTYEGAIVDSLRPPEAAYARSFETTAGLILPEGAFLAYSSFWIPTRPEEVFTFDLVVDTPTEWRAVSQGRMAKDVAQGGRREMRWECTHPMEEIYLVAGPYTENHLRHGDVMAQTFTYADTDSSIYNRYLRGTGAYLDLYEEKIGPYPFAKFALVENFWQSGFGMPSFTLLGDRVIRLPFILDTSYGHEILHNWWGNGVFVDREGGNWCEGLTTYGADYFYEERKDEESATRYRLNALQNYRDYVSESEDVPLARFRERHDFTTQAVGYSKSMMVIHQLRLAVGDAAFDSALRDFYRANLWRRASWTDLFTSFSRHAEIDPELWRAQWIERPGAPVLRIENVERTGKEGHCSVSFDLVQEPMDGGEPYTLRVPVRVLDEHGHQVDREVQVRDARTPVTVACGFDPLVVAVDPDFHVMRRLHREEIPARLSQVLGADSVAIVVADGLSGEVRSAFETLAAEWAGGHRAGIFSESEVLSRGVQGQGDAIAYWFLGRGALAEDAIARSGLALDDVEPAVSAAAAGTRSVVLTGAAGEVPWGLLDASRAPDVAALGRKVPHYGKYSFLAFEDGENVAKGTWPAGDSPLRHRFR